MTSFQLLINIELVYRRPCAAKWWIIVDKPCHIVELKLLSKNQNPKPEIRKKIEIQYISD